MYVVGGLGGFEGVDGVNPIEFFILVGNADRQWLEPHYYDQSIKPLGNIRMIIPAGPNHPNALLDACIAFYPQHFRFCPSFAEVESTLGETSRLDFDTATEDIPLAWNKLREEARPLFAEMNIWGADFVPILKK